MSLHGDTVCMFKLQLGSVVTARMNTKADMHLLMQINTHKHFQFSMIPLLNKLSESLEFVRGNKEEFNRRGTSRGI